MASTVVHEHVDHLAEEHDHEHHDNFITKYIFSQDHKTIAKQYLITWFPRSTTRMAKTNTR